MKRFYKVYIQHFSQKNNHSSVECFLLADSCEAVYDWLNKEKHCGWDGRDEDGEVFEIYDEECSSIGEGTFKERMISLGGEYFDEDLELSDLYYGKTVYGWEEMDRTVLGTKVAALRGLGVLDEV